MLVATDIAARGIHVDEISHVINYELPNVPESYVHRIGRTARAGAAGIAISFCNGEERAFLRDIEKLTRLNVPVAALPAGLSAGEDTVSEREPARRQSRRQPQRPQRQKSGQRGHGRPHSEGRGRPTPERQGGGERDSAGWPAFLERPSRRDRHAQP